MHLVKYSLLLLYINSFTVNAGWLGGADTYNDCVIENTKKIKNKKTVKQIRSACSDKYSKELTAEQITKIEGTAYILNFDNSPVISLKLYNGLRDIYLTEIDIYIQFKDGTTRIYKNKSKIPPLSEEEDYIKLNASKDRYIESWNVDTAKGYSRN